ncbi:CRISPR-associated protein, Cse3 family, partial [mine drainage metagenome]
MAGLTLVRLVPSMMALVAWARARGVPVGSDDTGYALHAALRATLGDVGPQPWMLRPRRDSVELLGYSRAAPEEVDAARLLILDPEAGHALGLADLTTATMPTDWQVGLVLSFEARVRPVVRESRTKSELDAAVVARARRPDADRAQVYHEWLARELERRNAAELISSRLVSF